MGAFDPWLEERGAVEMQVAALEQVAAVSMFSRGGGRT